MKPGQKTFFAVLNNPAADAMGHISWSVGATTLDDFRQSSFEAARGNAQGIGPDLSVYKDGVFMMLSDGKEVLLESDQFLRVELSCNRLGSKGQMLWKDIQLSPSFVDNDINPRNDDIADNDGDPVSKVTEHLSLDQTAGFQLMNVQGTMWVAAPAAPAGGRPSGGSSSLGGLLRQRMAAGPDGQLHDCFERVELRHREYRAFEPQEESGYLHARQGAGVVGRPETGCALRDYQVHGCSQVVPACGGVSGGL